ncbi:phosphatase inhibitor-domain-containing protein, partial [Cyathus striatus]
RILPPPAPVGALRLRGGPKTRKTQRVVWDDKVVDNEGAGRKSSKICCIYHKPRRFDESSSESDSDDSDSDSSCGGHNHNPSHNPNNNESTPHRPLHPTHIHELSDSDSEPNAYEVVPKYNKKGKGTGKGKKPAAGRPGPAPVDH